MSDDRREDAASGATDDTAAGETPVGEMTVGETTVGETPGTAGASSTRGATGTSGRRDRGRALRIAALSTSAVALLAAATGVVALGERYSPSPPAAVAAPVVDVPAGDVTRVCPGPPTLTAGEGMSVDPDVDPADVVPVTLTQVLSLPREDAPAADAGYTPLEGSATPLERLADLRLLTVEEPEGAGVLSAGPAGDTTALTAGAALTRTNAGDLRGLVAATCLAPATTTWLVGGATELGRSARLVLTNTGRTPATVDVTLWTSLGLTEAPRLQGITVAPGAQTALLLESAAAADPSLALRVDAAGGEVTATVQDHRLEGIVAAGIDVVSPAAPPALRSVVPGVVLDGAGPDAPATSAVRLVNPGETTATVTVRLLGADEVTEVPGATDVVLDPGAVHDVSLAGSPAGTYAVELTSDEPVTGAVVLARTGTAGALDPDTAPVDRAWTAAAPALTTAVLPVPGLGRLADTATLALTNPAEDEVDVELTPVTADGALGEPVSVTVPGGRTRATDAGGLGDVVAVLVRAGGEGVVSAVALTAAAADGELLTVLPAAADPHTSRSVRVDLR